jgi:hypothetical protein
MDLERTGSWVGQGRRRKPHTCQMNRSIPWIEGRTVSDIHFDGPTWGWGFGEDVHLNLETPWRIMAAGQIAFGDRDHEQSFGMSAPVDGEIRAMQLVVGRTVKNATVASESADLTVDFGDGIRLEVFNSSAGYEGWRMDGPNEKWIGGLGGGETVWT